ncbi:hypothetical protein EJB05_41599, partial [Eragrostis curvula]
MRVQSWPPRQRQPPIKTVKRAPFVLMKTLKRHVLMFSPGTPPTPRPCDCISHQYRAGTGDALAGMFRFVAMRSSSQVDTQLLRTVCAVTLQKKSVAAACKAASDALIKSSEAFTELCKASFIALPQPRPPPPPPPSPPTPLTCEYFRVYKPKCMDLFINNKTNTYPFTPLDRVEKGHKCPTLRARTYECSVAVQQPTEIRLSALIFLYILPLKGIFCPSHRDSFLYINFLRTHHSSISILYINYTIFYSTISNYHQ